MIIRCYKCGARFDDEYRSTICPHETLAANDGRNNFAHHPESLLDTGPIDREIRRAQGEAVDLFQEIAQYIHDLPAPCPNPASE
jgi:hypothetical protein